MKKITAPFDKETLEDLKIGDEVLISGTIYTMRDAAHARIFEMHEEKKKLPLDFTNMVIYYCGPTPAREGNIIGSCGPTTSSRMDKFTPLMLKLGVRGMIGKGERSTAIKDELKHFGAVYLSAMGGLGAEYARSVVKSEVVAFEDLGPEAIYKLEVEDFYAVVVNDAEGADLYVSLHIS